MNLKLTAIVGAYEGTVMVVPPGECVSFGRTVASQRSFPQDTHMSSRHFEVENFGDFAEVRDNGSTNGTWLNNSRITQEQLKSGDQLRAGTTVFSVELEQTACGSLQPQASPALPPADEQVFDPSGQSTNTADSRNRSLECPQDWSPSPTPDSLSETSARLNPFSDSIDVGNFVSDRAAAEPPRNSSLDLQGDSGRRISPFTDSIFVPVPGVAAPDSPRPSDDSGSPGCSFFAKRWECPSQEGWTITAEGLSRFFSVMPIVHPLKIRQAVPESCRSTVYLWNNLGEARSFGPIALSWPDFKVTFEPFLGRLLAADGFLVFFGTGFEDLAKFSEQLTQANVEGFSEKGGFLTCFWPSSLVTILQALGPGRLPVLMSGPFVGVLLPCPWDPSVVMAAGNHEFCHHLKHLNFQQISRLSESHDLNF